MKKLYISYDDLLCYVRVYQRKQSFVRSTLVFFFFCWQYFCSTLANDSGTIAQRPIVSPNGQFDVDPASLAQQGMRLQT